MFQKILVPVDPAETGFAQEALDQASKFASDYGARIHLLAVCPEVQTFVASQLPDGWQQSEIEQTTIELEKLAASLKVPQNLIDTNVRLGTIYHEVIEEAETAKCDLILMTSHKPSLSTYFIGSNAAQIVRHAGCSVMVLRGN